MNVVQADASGKPLENFGQHVVTASFHGGIENDAAVVVYRVLIDVGVVSALYPAMRSRGVGATEHSDLVSGYSFEQGLVKFEDIVREYSYSQNGEAYHRDGEKLHEYFERKGFVESQFQFIVVQYDGKEYGDNGERYDGVKIYKSPDFKSHWAALEAADLERWEKWLNN